MTPIMPSRTGEDVSVLADDDARINGEPTGHGPEAPATGPARVGDPKPAERREHGRAPVELDISAWTLMQSTRRLAGHTVNVSDGGARLWLPELSPFATTLQLSIALPDGPVHARASVRWRADPALVGIVFEYVDPDERARLLSYVREPR